MKRYTKRPSLALVPAALGFLATLPLPARAQDADADKTAFNKCPPCHSIGEGAANKSVPP